MSQMLSFMITLFQSAWTLLTSWTIFGLNPAEISFAILLIILIIRYIIKPVFIGENGGEDNDSH